MAGAKKQRSSESQGNNKGKPLSFHAFWSGSLSFGLVNVPVLIFPASRQSGVRLRMIGQNGTPLVRRFYCSRDGHEVKADEIVRGFELDDGSYVIINDDELEDLEPQKTREIDLRQFVNLSEISPAFLERGYFLTPLKEATKAYRLLAEVMESTQRAGIATFVMRDREYLVAIFAQNGILCAETLRFQDEVRDPRTIGLPEPKTAPRRDVATFERAIDALTAKTIPRDLLVDSDTIKLQAIIDKKIRAGDDVIRVTHEPRNADSEEEAEVDLLDTIRRSLRLATKEPVSRPKPGKPSQYRTSGKKKVNRRKPAKQSPTTRRRK
jgi:DNA end-binding protein Ku